MTNQKVRNICSRIRQRAKLKFIWGGGEKIINYGSVPIYSPQHTHAGQPKRRPKLPL
jgi:hypothetical protein